jgi:hypothetical protein
MFFQNFEPFLANMALKLKKVLISQHSQTLPGDLFYIMFVLCLSKSRLADPHHFNSDPNPVFYFNANPDQLLFTYLGYLVRNSP